MCRIFKIATVAVLLLAAGAKIHGQGWLAETMVNTVTDGKQASRGTDTPWSLVTDNNGKVHVVWEDRRDEPILSIYYRGKSPSPTWDNWDSHDINISPTDSIELIGHPSIGALDNGSLISIFAEERTFGGELLGAILPTGFSCWSSPHYVSIPGGNSLSFNSTGWQTTIATNGHRAITFWPYIGNDLDDFRPIFYRKYVDGEWFGAEIPLSLPEIGLHYYAKNLSAIWARRDTVYLVFACMPEWRSIYQIELVKLNFNDSTISDFQILAADTIVSLEFPYICRYADKNGHENIAVVYDEHGVNESAKMISFSEISGAWSAPMTLGDTSMSSGYPCLAANPSGAIELTFEQPGNEPHSQIYHQSFYPDSSVLGTPIKISEGEYFSKRPVIACDKFGNIHISYISNKIHPWDPGNEEVLYRMYDSAPLRPTNVVITDDTIRWEYIDPPDLRHFQIFSVINSETTLIGGTINHYFHHNLGANAIAGVRAVDLNWQSSSLVLADMNNGINVNSEITPGNLEIGPNYPNPFNSATVFSLRGNPPKLYNTRLEIFDILGRAVKSIEIAPDLYNIVWDGTTQSGAPAVSGLYFYRLIGQSGSSPARKMILLR